MSDLRFLFLAVHEGSVSQWRAELAKNPAKYEVEIKPRSAFTSGDIAAFDMLLVESEPASTTAELDFFKELRSRTNMPILVISSLADEEHIVHLYKVAVDDYVLKPISAKLLYAKLAVWQRWLLLSQRSATSKAKQQIH